MRSIIVDFPIPDFPTIAVILFFLGSGPVKGFAVTLGTGILTTLFCAYFFARHLSSIYVMKNKDKKITI